ncbi:integrase arm-type DNA-binding domain-containing protein [Chromobacterium vaccinii]|uniref:integrase arm-type DNA-binding domain-containing protein n=1 Tax=Chromobacterium vaccinii TaxID=1108595 RepID=UPI000E17E5E1|nr:integrase arm-type DNA-binding domain-containing protein [Chromobacterium vaccinii]SUX54609.1 Uncharacterised protein [Chromobacterium vaccinii]
MAKINFTSSRIDSFKCPDDKKQAFLWDTRAPGLGLRTTPQGSKSYIFQGKLLQQSIRVTIGDPRAWSIEQAQDEARRLQRLIDGGQDPRAERTARLHAEQQRKAEAKRQYVTLGEAWEVYIRIRRPKWSERHLDRPDVESLTSYVCRLAYSHGMASQKLVDWVLGFFEHTVCDKYGWHQRNLSSMSVESEQWAAWSVPLPMDRGLSTKL